MSDVWKKLTPPERSRTYHWPTHAATFFCITHLHVSASGTHYLTCEDGKKVIVPAGWLYLTFDADDWTHPAPLTTEARNG